MGGHIFNNQSSPINKENIKPTLDKYFNELKRLFPKKEYMLDISNFILIGSTGKKEISGDIDLGVSIKDILPICPTRWNINPMWVRDEFLLLHNRAKTSSNEQLQNKAFLKVLSNYINNHSDIIKCMVKKTTSGNIFTLSPQYDKDDNKLNINVQIDWMIGNLKWIDWSYFSDIYPEYQHIKGLHRTQLLLSAFQVADLSFHHIDGIKDKITKEITTNDPDQALQVLGNKLGFIIPKDHTNNYFDLIKLFKYKMRSNDYNSLLNIYLKILDSTRCDIPENIQGEWIARKNTLSLTGNFLPENSKLILDRK